MRLKSMNNNNNNNKSSNQARNNSNSGAATKNGMNFNILNHDINENSFDLDMDSAEYFLFKDEIDVGTHADNSMLINHNHHLQDYHPFPTNTNSSSSSLIISNKERFSTLLNNQAINQDIQSHFAVPQHTTTMSEADRKRAHHNALERKRRDHIKDSFHTLRDAIPNIKGEKVSTSRAQILKAATDYIKTMKNRNTVYQNDIDLIKKQNMDIEAQIRQLEKSKPNGNQCLNSTVIIKTEQIHHHPLTPPTHMCQMSGNDTSDEQDFKFDLNESMQSISNNNNNMLPHSNSIQNKPNNVLILSKPNAGQQTTSKKFKTIVTPKPSLMNNNFL